MGPGKDAKEIAGLVLDAEQRVGQQTPAGGGRVAQPGRQLAHVGPERADGRRIFVLR